MTFYNNSKDSTGTLYYNDSEDILYHGQFSNDLRNGFGTLYFPNNNILYKGQWTNNMSNGLVKNMIKMVFYYIRLLDV